MQYELPDRDWLANEYLLPPRGKGRSCTDIGRDFGVTKRVVQRWVKFYGLTEDTKTRLAAHQTKPHPERRIPAPPQDEFEKLYKLPPHGRGFTEDQLAAHYNVSRPTARRWIDEYDLKQDFSERHSQRMSGSGNAAWDGGRSTHYGKRLALKIADRQQCRWCGDAESLQVHHMDHDRSHNAPGNLILLCGTCNRLEAQLWALQQKGLVEVRWNKNELRVTFKHSKE